MLARMTRVHTTVLLSPLPDEWLFQPGIHPIIYWSSILGCTIIVY